MDQKKTVLKTGIEGLDEMLNGGLISGRTYIISGPPGSGKTTLGIQFLVQGLKEKETVLFVAVDEPPNEIKFNYSRFEWNMANLRILDANSDIRRLEPTPVLDITSKSMTRRVSEIPDVIRKTPDFESVIVTIHSLQQAVKQLIDRQNCTRLVIDSMSGVKYFCMEGLDENTSTQSFMRFLAETKVTTLLLLETGETVPLTPELFLARGELRLHKWWNNGMLHRGLSIELIRGSRHDETIRPMEITKAGMVVYNGINDWKRKTAKKSTKYKEDDFHKLRADFALLEKSLQEAPSQFENIPIDFHEITFALASAKAHLEKAEYVYAFEITAFAKKIFENKMALPNSLAKIMSVENKISSYKTRQMVFPEVDELLKKAKECVNKNNYPHALAYAQECEVLLTQKLKELDQVLKEAEEKAAKETEAPMQPVVTKTVTKPTVTPAYVKETPHKAPRIEDKETTKETSMHQKIMEAQITATQDAFEKQTLEVLKTETVAPPPSHQEQKFCPYCLKELTFIRQYNRWYCYSCKKYAPKNH